MPLRPGEKNQKIRKSKWSQCVFQCINSNLVVNIHDVKSQGIITNRWNTSAVYNIVRFRYQRMDVIDTSFIFTNVYKKM